jgi:hypothetical protein
MNPLRKACLAGGFALCFFAGGWIWWRGSYQEYLSTSFHWETWPLLASVAVILSWIIGIRVIPTALVVGSSFPAIVLARVFLVDSPTSHNLWPFEVAGALLFGMMMAFPPAGLGWLLRHITNFVLGYLSKKDKSSQAS